MLIRGKEFLTTLSVFLSCLFFSLKLGLNRISFFLALMCSCLGGLVRSWTEGRLSIPVLFLAGADAPFLPSHVYSSDSFAFFSAVLYVSVCSPRFHPSTNILRARYRHSTASISLWLNPTEWGFFVDLWVNSFSCSPSVLCTFEKWLFIFLFFLRLNNFWHDSRRFNPLGHNMTEFLPSNFVQFFK